MCASEKTLQQGEHEKTEAEIRMDEAFPTIFMRMRKQARRLFFWRKNKPVDDMGYTLGADKGGFRESLRRRFLGNRDKATSDAKLVELENAEETNAVIRDNAEAAASDHPNEVHLEQHPHSQ